MNGESIINAMIGIPIGFLGNVSTKVATDIYNNYFNKNIEPLEKIFINSFMKSIDYHKKCHDETSKLILDDIKNQVKKDKKRLIWIFYENTQELDRLLQQIGDKEFQIKIAKDIIAEFKIQSNYDIDIIIDIISDSLQYYKTAFFNNMTEKEAFITILKESLKIDNIVNILRELDSSIATKEDVESLKNLILSSHYNENSLEQKGLKDYDKYIINNFKYLELRGISPKVCGEEVKMELLDLYVSQEIKESKYIIPDICNTDVFKMNDRKEIIKNDNVSFKNKLSADKILGHTYSVILGDPGAGKSTLLKYLALYVAKNRTRLADNGIKFIVPIYVKATQYSDYLEKNPECSLYEFITQYYDKQYNKFIQKNFEYSNILLLIDALDEIRNTSLRIKVSEQVHKLISKYPYNQYIVTSRIVGYHESRLGVEFKHFKLIPFQEEQINAFAHNWYKSIAKHSDKNYKKANEVAEELYNSIYSNKSVFRVAENPLLMTIISMIHYRGKRLPNKRIELYDICTETFLEYWVQLRLNDESRIKSKEEIIEILSPISFFIHKHKELGLIEEKDFKKQFMDIYRSIHTTVDERLVKKECNDFIEFLRKDAGFFYEKGQDEDGYIYYGFIHQTFQEYFAAVDFLNRLEFDSLNIEEYIFNSRWVEIIRLAVAQIRLSNRGIAGRKKCSDLINKILDVKDSFKELYRPLQLVCLILADDVEVTDDTYSRIILSIKKLLSRKCNKIIIKSFSLILSNLIKSNYCDRILSNIFMENVNQNSILLENLMKIIIDNYEEDKIKIVYNDFLNNVNFSLSSLENIIDYAIKNREENMYCITNIIHNNLNLISNSDKSVYYYRIYAEFNKLNINSTYLSLLKNTENSKLSNRNLYIILENFLDNYLCSQRYDNNKFEDKIMYLSEYEMTRNLMNCLKKIDYKNKLQNLTGSARNYRRYKALNYNFLIITSDNSKKDKNAVIWYWDRMFREVSYFLFNMGNCEMFERELSNKNLIESEIEALKVLIEYNIHFESFCNSNLEKDDKNRFYFLLEELYKKDLLKNFYDWSVILRKNPCYEKKVLSDIIFENISLFLSNVSYEDNLEICCESDTEVLPHIKLLNMYLQGKTISEELIDDVIKYYHTASGKQKNGIFLLLNKLLNY